MNGRGPDDSGGPIGPRRPVPRGSETSGPRLGIPGDCTRPARRGRRLTALACVVGLLVASSCGEELARGHTEPVVSAGVTSYGVTFGTWNGRVAVAVVCDVPAIRASSGTTSEGVEYHGVHGSAGGDAVRWSCTTSDGTSGTVEIDGTAHDLSDGLLFLVTAATQPPSVRQLTREPGPEEDFLQELLLDPLVLAQIEAFRAR